MLRFIINQRLFLLFVIVSMFGSCNQPEETKVDAPEPVGPTPSERQMQWYENNQYYMFIHYNMNTYTDMEWGTGGESPQQFNPTNLDVEQWAKTAKQAGMSGIILTAKHHDGFCLWPTATTDHSIEASPYKNGEGDIVKELQNACEKYDLEMGLYLSPWDRNNANYGDSAYVETFHNQLRELTTNYGPLFEIWFDGANGGTGYYGGANEERKINNETYYDWETVYEIVRNNQPNAMIFSDEGPDVRWVGNEEGWANETNWSIMRRDEITPGWPRYKELRSGHEDGTHWLPAEADVSIRPGWYYHASEDHQVKSVQHLVDIYYKSIGRNASLNLNVPVNQQGRIPTKDSIRLMEFKQVISDDFDDPLLNGVSVTATNTRGNHSSFEPTHVLDTLLSTYWSTDDEVIEASIQIEFPEPTGVNRLVLQEYITLGQRVQAFSVEALVDDEWQVIDEQTTIAFKRILRFPTIETSTIRITIHNAKGPVALSTARLYHAPQLVVPPTYSRTKAGMVTLQAPEGTTIYYSTDGTEPTTSSTTYDSPFELLSPTTLQAIAVDPATGKSSDVLIKQVGPAKRNWRIVKISSGELSEATKAIDDDPMTTFETTESGENQSITIDLEEEMVLDGFTYTPMQGRYPKGLIHEYTFSVSLDGATFTTVHSGEFSNIQNNRIQQTVLFDTQHQAKYIRLQSTNIVNNDELATIGEIGIIVDQKNEKQ